MWWRDLSGFQFESYLYASAAKAKVRRVRSQARDAQFRLSRPTALGPALVRLVMLAYALKVASQRATTPTARPGSSGALTTRPKHNLALTSLNRPLRSQNGALATLNAINYVTRPSTTSRMAVATLHTSSIVETGKVRHSGLQLSSDPILY